MRLIFLKALLVLPLLVAPASAHVGPHDAIYAWNWDPVVLVSLAVSAVLYAAGLRRSRHGRARTITTWQSASFWSGWAVLALALVSPVHRIGAALFSVHMSQHTLLMLLAAPLLVMGRPLIAFLWALPPHWRQGIGGSLGRKGPARLWRMLSAPLFVWCAQAVVLWIWHIPSLYTAAVSSEGIHAVQHSMFLLTALLFWWTLIHGRYGRMGYGVAVLYVFATAVHSGLLGALLTLTDRVWFAVHEGHTTVWNLSPLEDQQLAGLIMWIPAGFVFIVVGLALFAAWLGEADRRLALSRMAALREPERDA